MPDVSPDKEMEKRRKAMKSRLEKLGTDNLVVKMAVNSNEPKRDTYKEFAVVDELVNAARNKYREQGNFKVCVSSLAEALGRLAKTGKAEGVDKTNSNSENGLSEDEY